MCVHVTYIYIINCIVVLLLVHTLITHTHNIHAYVYDIHTAKYLVQVKAYKEHTGTAHLPKKEEKQVQYTHTHTYTHINIHTRDTRTYKTIEYNYIHI